jgi:hypothetical protein
VRFGARGLGRTVPLSAEVKIRRAYLEGGRDSEDVSEARVTLSALDTAYVRRVQFRELCESHLSKPSFEAYRANRLTEGDVS